MNWKRLAGWGRSVLAGTVLALGLGCAAITPFDQNSYQAAVGIKTEALGLMQQAATQAPSETLIAPVENRLAAQIAYETGKGRANLISATQWRLIARPEGHLLGGFLREWRAAAGPLSAVYVAEKQQQVGRAFDEVLRLEGGKLR